MHPRLKKILLEFFVFELSSNCKIDLKFARLLRFQNLRGTWFQIFKNAKKFAEKLVVSYL